MFYGNNIDQETLYEITMLNEMHISKNDLKDPNILKKVLEKSKEEAKNSKNAISVAAMVLGLAADIATGLITGSIFLSLGAFFPFIIGACMIGLAVIQKLPDFEKKNVNKLEEKTKKLKEKVSKLKDSSEKKKIIETCDKILKSIEDYKKKKIDDAKKEEYEKNKNYVKYIIDSIEGKARPHSNLSDIYEIYVVADKMGVVNSQVLDKGYTKYCLSHLDKEGIMVHITNHNNYKDAIELSHFSEEDLKQYEKLIPGFKENAPFFNIGSHDEGLFFFNQKNNSYYYGAYGFFDQWDIDKSLFNIVQRYSKANRIKVDVSKEEINMYKEIYESLKGNKDN